MIDNSLQFYLRFIILFKISKSTCGQFKKHFHSNENEDRRLITFYTDKPNAIKNLSKKLSISAALTSKILNSLKLKGLISRMLSEQDKRNERVLFTEKGVQVTSHIIEFIKDSVCKKIKNIFNKSHEYLKIFAEIIKMEVSNHRSLEKFILNN